MIEKTVDMAIVSKIDNNLNLLLKSQEIKICKDTTVMDLLKKEVEDCRIIGPMVLSIKGLESKRLSGWLYSVNGKVPSLLAEEYILKDKDKIIWYYTDEGMEAELPQWEEVIKLEGRG